MELIVGIIVSLAVGGGVVYAVLSSRSVRLETQLEERKQQLNTALQERVNARGELHELSQELMRAKAAISGYQSTQAERDKAFAERREELDTHFKGLASEVLGSSTEEFRKQAAEQFKVGETAVENLIKPVRESL